MITVGIILPEDNASKLIFHTENNAQYIAKNNNQDIILQPNTTYSILLLQSNTLQLQCNQDILAQNINYISIETLSPCNLDKTKCITWEQIPAGRTFHWCTSITATFPNNFQVIAQENNLVLVNILELEDYITCVAVSEMGKDCPTALIQAQMIVARSWFLAHAEKKHGSLYDVCNDDCCQRYQGIKQLTNRIIQIAQTTKDLVLKSAGKICDTRYHKNCGGLTENAEFVWSNTKESYLQTIMDSPEQLEIKTPEAWIHSEPNCYCSSQYVPQSALNKYLGYVDTKDNYFRWHLHYSASELTELLKSKGLSLQGIVCKLEVLKRGNSFRITQLKIITNQNECYILDTEYTIRKMLHKSFLYSSAFIVEQKENNFDFYGAGWGHGVGLCQMGALGMALNHMTYEEILHHYFLNSEIEKL